MIIYNATNAAAFTVFLCPDAYRDAIDAECSVAWPSSQRTRICSRYCSADSRSFTVEGFWGLERSRFHWHTNRRPCCSALVYSLMALIIESSSFLRASVSVFKLCRRLFISSSTVDWNFVSPQALSTKRLGIEMTRQVTDRLAISDSSFLICSRSASLSRNRYCQRRKDRRAFYRWTVSSSVFC